jgi:hypothetical protein
LPAGNGHVRIIANKKRIAKNIFFSRPLSTIGAPMHRCET